MGGKGELWGGMGASGYKGTHSHTPTHIQGPSTYPSIRSLPRLPIYPSGHRPMHNLLISIHLTSYRQTDGGGGDRWGGGKANETRNSTWIFLRYFQTE